MNFSFRRLAILFGKTLLKALLVCVLLFGGCMFIMSQRTRAPYKWELQNQYGELTHQAKIIAANSSNQPLFLPGPQHAKFQKLIGELYPTVGMIQFISPNLIHVTFATEERQKYGLCQAIANLWSFKSKEMDVSVQCWEGENCVAKGSVIGGRLVQTTGLKTY